MENGWCSTGTKPCDDDHFLHNNFLVIIIAYHVRFYSRDYVDHMGSLGHRSNSTNACRTCDNQQVISYIYAFPHNSNDLL